MCAAELLEAVRNKLVNADPYSQSTVNRFVEANPEPDLPRLQVPKKSTERSSPRFVGLSLFDQGRLLRGNLISSEFHSKDSLEKNVRHLNFKTDKLDSLAENASEI